MNDRDNRRYDRITRVQTFGRNNAGDFAPGSKASREFAKVDNLILGLDRAKADQTPARVSKTTLLDAMTLDFQNVARTARAIELYETGFAAPYRLPDTPAEIAITTHADAVLLLLEDQADDAAAVKTAKAALRAKFIDYELPPDFVADLRAARNAVAEANRHNQDEVQAGVENTALIDELLGQAAGVVTELNAIMHNKYSRQPEKLRAWQSASRVERAPQRRPAAAPISISASSTPGIKAA